MESVNWWRAFLQRVEIRGALPILFFIDDNQAVTQVEVDDVETGLPYVIERKVPIPPYIPTERKAIDIVQSWARYMYIHEMREQFYLDDKRADVPDEEH